RVAGATDAIRALLTEEGPCQLERLPRTPFSVRLTRQTKHGRPPLVFGLEELQQTAAVADGTAPDDRADPFAGVALIACAPLLLWVLWGFAWRGGVSFRLAGLALVRRSGRKALRLQCAVRTLAAGLPLAAVLLLVAWTDLLPPDNPWHLPAAH